MNPTAPERERTVVRPTVFGVVVAVAVVATAVVRPAVADPSVVGFVWAGLAGALLFGCVWPIVTVRRVGLHARTAPTDLLVDQLGTLELELTGRASGLRLSCTGQHAVVVDVVAPGTVRLPFTVGRRGAFSRVRVEVGSDAPFAVLTATRTRLVTLPRQLFVAPVPVAERAAPGDLSGEQAAPRPAGVSQRGDSVRGVRPYVSGDPSHLVHWPSSARTATLVVRELEPPSTLALAVVLDLRAGPAGGTGPLDASAHASSDADPAVEHAAARASGLAESALDQGARVLLCTAEANGPVAGEVADVRALRRRIALAEPGPPGAPPDGWKQVRLTPGAPEGSVAQPATLDSQATASGPDTDTTDEPASDRVLRGDRSAGDRHTISGRRIAALTLLVAAQLYAALSALPGERGSLPGLAAAVCAALAMFGLRSVPIRWIVRGFALLSGAMLARFGELDVRGGLTGSWTVLAWLGATAAALALAPSSRSVLGGHGVVLRADDIEGTAPVPAAERFGATRPASIPAALLLAAIALIAAASLLVGPRAANAFPVGSKVGDVVDFGQNRSNNVLSASDSLDMTQRPRLSDRVVMSVRSPIVAFWRTEVFDAWDGSRWTRSRGDAGHLVEGGRILPDAHDIAATEGEPTTQEFRLEAGFATALPSAASPVRVDSPTQLGHRVDGTLVSPYDPLGRGSTYTVESRQMRLDAATLRAADGPTPQAILRRFAQMPRATERVRRLASEVTASATNDFDRIRALERWMNENTEYSLDAPLSPEGVDVVDHFLFEEQLGWCEQIASSLVVMARSVGIPARVATGFAPGEWDGVTQRFVVRERDAHAWAEVWFPGAGWVAFDPTAAVPLAGSSEATAGATAYDPREILGAVLLVVGLTSLMSGSVARAVRRRVERWQARVRRRRLRRSSWDVAEELRLEQLGARAGRPREPSETISTYAAVLAPIVGDEDLAATGAEIDRSRYAVPTDA